MICLSIYVLGYIIAYVLLKRYGEDFIEHDYRTWGDVVRDGIFAIFSWIVVVMFVLKFGLVQLSKFMVKRVPTKWL